MFWLQDGALDVLVLLDPMLFGVAGQHQGQSTVTGDVAGSAEAVLQGKDGQHQGGAGVIKHQHASDQAQRGHDRTAGDTGSADGEDAEQQAEQDHGADARQLAVEDLGDGHAEEHFRQDRAAQMDVGKQGDAKADHILAQDLALAGAVQSDSQGGGAGHGADSGQVCGTIVAEHFPGVLARVSACQQIQDRQPDVMADHDDNDDLQERGQLMGDHALIAQIAERGGNVERQDGNDDLADDVQHDVLELGQEITGELAVGPGSGQANQHAENQRAHDTHNLGDIQLKHNARQLPQASDFGVDGQVRDQRVAGSRAHKCRADGRNVSDDNRHAQQAGRVLAQLGDGRCDKADDDERDTERDELAHDVLQGNDHPHETQREDLTQDNADHDAQQQPERQIVQ